MTRMERRRRRRRILRIKLATIAAVLALTTASIVALTGGAAETVPEPTPQPPALQAEPVLLTAEHDSMLTFYFATSGVYAEPVIEDRLAKQICRIVWESHLTLHEREELFLDTIRDDTLPEHIMSAKDCAYIFDVCAAGRVEDAREMLGRFVTAHVAK